MVFRLAAELKEKRKSRSENKRKERAADADAVSEQKPNENEVTALPEKSRSRKRKGRRADASNSGEELEGKDVGPVKLDESVLELLREREKYVISISSTLTFQKFRPPGAFDLVFASFSILSVSYEVSCICENRFESLKVNRSVNPNDTFKV